MQDLLFCTTFCTGRKNIWTSVQNQGGAVWPSSPAAPASRPGLHRRRVRSARHSPGVSFVSAHLHAQKVVHVEAAARFLTSMPAMLWESPRCARLCVCWNERPVCCPALAPRPANALGARVKAVPERYLCACLSPTGLYATQRRDYRTLASDLYPPDLLLQAST